MGGSKSKFLNTKTALKTGSKFYQAGSFFRESATASNCLLMAWNIYTGPIAPVGPYMEHIWDIHFAQHPWDSTTNLHHNQGEVSGHSWGRAINDLANGPPDVQEK